MITKILCVLITVATFKINFELMKIKRIKARLFYIFIGIVYFILIAGTYIVEYFDFNHDEVYFQAFTIITIIPCPILYGIFMNSKVEFFRLLLVSIIINFSFWFFMISIWCAGYIP